MKHLFALLAVASTVWAYSPTVRADDTNDLSTDSSAMVAPGHGGGGFAPHSGGAGPGFGHPGGGGFAPHPAPGFGGGHPGPGFGGGRPGPGPGFHGGPGFAPHPGGWGPRPGGWGPGRGIYRPGWNPGWSSGYWAHPGWWHFPYLHPYGWWPTIFIPLPAPPVDMGDSLCYGNYAGMYGNNQDAYLALDTNGENVNGNFVTENPEEGYPVTGSCEQVGLAADVNISFNGSAPFVGEIYRADDGQVYFEGTQSGSNERFVLQRQPY